MSGREAYCFCTWLRESAKGFATTERTALWMVEES